jgi:hypothetical protein
MKQRPPRAVVLGTTIVGALGSMWLAEGSLTRWPIAVFIGSVMGIAVDAAMEWRASREEKEQDNDNS